nr:protein kinase [Planctomycetales bacterium]
MSEDQTSQLLGRIQKVCQAFESSWQSGAKPRLEDFLEGWDEPDRDILRSHLVAIRTRYQGGEAQPPGLGGDATAQSQRDETVAVPPPAKAAAAAPTAAADGSLPRGSQLGRYQIVQVLGQGGMGAVYLADDTELGRQVALKIPKLSASDPQTAMARFAREARAAAKISHPNICPIFDIGTADGHPFITMAYVEGKPLSDLLDANRALQPSLAVSLVRKLALALAEAHDRGIIHRDLKPSNVMIDKRGEPILMDFGLARLAQQPDVAHLTQTGSILGTPAYMAPEQVLADHEAIGPATDIFSLGVVLYQLLCGQVPFRGELMQMLLQIAQADPQPPQELRPSIDGRLNDLCLHMLAKGIADRPASMHDVAARLQEIESAWGGRASEETGSFAMPAAKRELPATRDSAAPSSSAAASPPTAVAAGRPPAKNRWLVAALGGGAALVLLGVVVLVTRVGDKQVKVTVADDPHRQTVVEADGESLKIQHGKKP